jgi:hypothetical protein
LLLLLPSRGSDLPSWSPFTRTALRIVALVGLAITVVQRLLGNPTTGIDDADIFLTYGRNLIEGHGFVFHVGGERVEGFTSLLWVVICGLAQAVSPEPERLLLVVGVFSLALTGAVCARSFVCRRWDRPDAVSPPWVAAMLVLLFSHHAFLTWNTVTLMDTPLWTLLVTISTVLIADDAISPRVRAWALPIVTLLLVSTRPEAFLWVPVVLAVGMARSRAYGGHGLTRPLAISSLAFLAALLALLAFRLWYFGFPLPNTYYAKVSPSLVYTLQEGAAYLLGYLTSGPLPMLAVAALVVSAVHLFVTRGADTRTLSLTVLGFVCLLTPVLGGGDHFEGFRFYQGAYPTLLLALLNCIRFVVPRYVALPAALLPRRRRLVAGAVAAGVFVAVTISDWAVATLRAEYVPGFDAAAAGRRRGEDIARLFSGLAPLPVVGTITAGGLQYSYPGRVFDLMGLNDVRMAHNGGMRVGPRSHAAFDKETFYRRPPGLVIPLVQFRTVRPLQRPLRFVDVVLRGVTRDERFRDMYRVAIARRNTSRGPVRVAAYYRRDVLAALASSGKVDVQVMP